MGKLPFAGLIEANDGNFYGVTAHGGSSNKGVLFRMTPDGVLTVLHTLPVEVTVHGLWEDWCRPPKGTCTVPENMAARMAWECSSARP